MEESMRLSVSPDRSGVEAGPVAKAPRSLLMVLFSRAALRSAALADRLGRIVLYAGLLVVGFTGLRAFGDAMTVADPFLLVSLLCALIAVFYRGTVNFGLFKAHLIGLALIVVGVAIAAVYRSSEEWASLLNLAKFIFSTTCLFFACSVLVRRPGHLRIALGIWVASACITALVGVLQAWLDPSAIVYQDVQGRRMTGLSGSPNHLGVIAGIAVAPALSLAAMSRGPAQAGWLLAAVLAASGVLVSASRTGAVAAAGSFALWVLLNYRLRREFTLFAAGCCLVGIVAIGFLHVEWWGGMNVVSRLETAATPTADSNVEWRLAQYDAVIRRSLQNPLVGFGLAGDQSGVYGQLVHSMYFRVLHGGGILALAGLLIVLGDLSYRGAKTYLSPIGYETKALAVACTSGVVALMLAGLTDTWLYQRAVWVPAALLFALWALPRQGTRQKLRRSSRRTAPGASSAKLARLAPGARPDLIIAPEVRDDTHSASFISDVTPSTKRPVSPRARKRREPSTRRRHSDSSLLTRIMRWARPSTLPGSKM
jgi:hypothetical protein